MMMRLGSSLAAGLALLGTAACKKQDRILADWPGQMQVEVTVTDSAHSPVPAQLQFHVHSILARPQMADFDFARPTDKAGHYADAIIGIWVVDSLRVTVTATPGAASGLSPASDSGSGLYAVTTGAPADTVRLAIVLH